MIKWANLNNSFSPFAVSFEHQTTIINIKRSQNVRISRFTYRPSCQNRSKYEIYKKKNISFGAKNIKYELLQ